MGTLGTLRPHRHPIGAAGSGWVGGPHVGGGPGGLRGAGWRCLCADGEKHCWQRRYRRAIPLRVAPVPAKHKTPPGVFLSGGAMGAGIPPPHTHTPHPPLGREAAPSPGCRRIPAWGTASPRWVLLGGQRASWVWRGGGGHPLCVPPPPQDRAKEEPAPLPPPPLPLPHCCGTMEVPHGCAPPTPPQTHPLGVCGYPPREGVGMSGGGGCVHPTDPPISAP